MEGEVSLAPYSKEQITKGEKLPERISSIKHDVETGEKLKLDYVVEQIADVSKSIAAKTDKKFVVLGSMSMYATLNELKTDGEGLMLLEQRISGGKNDYDIGVRPEELNETMTSFGWSEDTKKLQRGKVGNGSQMIDMMGRNERPHFPWRQTEVVGQECFVQTPEEMVFEKISALVNPNSDDKGETRLREIKWGVDIKLLKTYLTMKNNWSETDMEEYLAKRWGEYVEDTRYQGVTELSERVGEREGVEDVVRDALKKRLGKEQIDDVKQELVTIFGQGREPAIQGLFMSRNATEFSEKMRGLIDLRAGSKLTYEEASQKATQEYTGLLKGLLKQK